MGCGEVRLGREFEMAAAWSEALARYGSSVESCVSVKAALVREEASLESGVVCELGRGTRVWVEAAALEGETERLRIRSSTKARGWVSASCVRKAPQRLVVGLCFLVYGAVEFGDVWRWYLSDVDASRYRIIVHTKRPEACTLDVANVTILEDPVETEWGEISLVKATAKLLDAVHGRRIALNVISCSAAISPCGTGQRAGQAV